MATALVRKLFPGCTLRNGVKSKTIRFDAMVKGNRFVGTSKLTLSEAIDPKGRPTQALKIEYAKWRAKQECESIGPDNVGLRIPSIKELIDTYEEIAWERHHNPAHGDPSPRTIETAVKNYRYCVEASGIAMTRPYTELFAINTMRRVFDVFCSRRTKRGEKLQPVTAWTYLSSLQSVAADWTIPKYYDRGLDVRQPNMKAVDVGHAKAVEPYRSLPEEQKERIMLWYETLEDKLGKECRLAALLSLKLGMRPCDAVLVNASTFPLENGQRFLYYRPIKTFNRSRREVHVPLAAARWEEIQYLAGDLIESGEMFIKNPRTVYGKLNSSLRYCCDMRVEDGWDKGVYELRKMCYDMIWHDQEQGPEFAVALSGENRSTLEKYYADPYSTKKEAGA